MSESRSHVVATSGPTTSVKRRPLEQQDDDFKGDDIFNSKYERVSDRDPFTKSVRHSKVCKHGGELLETLGEIIRMNPATLGSGATFAKRPVDFACHLSHYKYNIVLTHTTVKCFGCRRPIRSSSHTCRTYDLFRPNDWLGKHRRAERVDIRRNNFRALAECLPYVLTDTVIGSSNVFAPSCQCVEFWEEVAVAPKQ